jgi:hypothetical protein
LDTRSVSLGMRFNVVRTVTPPPSSQGGKGGRGSTLFFLRHIIFAEGIFLKNGNENRLKMSFFLFQMAIYGGLLAIKMLINPPFSLYHHPSPFWFRPIFWSKQRSSNPQGVEGPHFLGATVGTGLRWAGGGFSTCAFIMTRLTGVPFAYFFFADVKGSATQSICLSGSSLEVGIFWLFLLSHLFSKEKT